MWSLSRNTVIRPEAMGALLFNSESAETAYIDQDGLHFLRDVLKGEVSRREIPISFFLYLQKTGMIVKSDKVSESSIREVDHCLDAETVELPNSLSAPETLHITLTDTCDQVCPGCFYSRKEGDPGKFISMGLFEKVVDDAKRVKVLQFAFGGGEPLLHPHLVEFVKMSVANRIVPNITTNGNLLTRELAVSLKRSALGQIQISLDAADETANAQTRPNHASAVRATEICRDVGLRFGINTLVTRQNLRMLPSLFAFALRAGAEGVNLLRPKPPVNSTDWLEESSLTPSDNLELYKLLSRHGGKGQIAVTLDQSFSFLAYHRKHDELYYNGAWGCGAGRKFLTIDPEGIIYPCSHFREPIGTDGDFMNAWNNSSLLTEFRLLEDNIKGQCKSCHLVSVCRGCRAVVNELEGGFFGDDPHCPSHANCTWAESGRKTQDDSDLIFEP